MNAKEFIKSKGMLRTVHEDYNLPIVLALMDEFVEHRLKEQKKTVKFTDNKKYYLRTLDEVKVLEEFPKVFLRVVLVKEVIPMPFIIDSDDVIVETTQG